MGQVWAHTRTKCRLWQKDSFLQVETDGDEPGFLSSEEPEAVIITDSGALPRSIQSVCHWRLLSIIISIVNRASFPKILVWLTER